MANIKRHGKYPKYQTAYRQRNKEYCNNAKGAGCVLCGYNKCLAALEFHHASDDKRYTISRSKNLTLAKLKAEVSKCIILCANCHREVHASDLESFGMQKHHAVDELPLFDLMTEGQKVGLGVVNG